MELTDLISLIGAVTAAAISVPQFALVVRTKHTHGLSLTTWVISLATAAGWFCHGLKLMEVNMMWPNAWGFIVAVTMLHYLRLNGRYRSLTKLLPGVGLAALLIGLDYGIGSAVFGATIVAPQAFGMLRQGIALMRAPQVTGVSITSWVFQVANQVVWLSWAIMTDEISTLISGVVSLVAASFVLIWRILRARGLGPIDFSRLEAVVRRWGIGRKTPDGSTDDAREMANGLRQRSGEAVED